MKDCIFCEIAEHRLPSHIIYEDDKVIVFMSLENHPLVAPKKHIADVHELDDIYAAALMQAMVKIANATKAATNCGGINLVQSNGKVAGQDVPHFHFHIKPRFENDSVILSWDTNTVDEEKRRDACEAIKWHMI